MFAYFNLPGNQLRVELKSVTGRRGIGVCGLLLNFELLEPSSGTAPFQGALLLIEGELFLSFETEGMHYAGRLHTSAPVVGASPVVSLDLSADLSPEQVREIQQKWKERPLTLQVYLHGAVLRSDGTAQPLYTQQLAFPIEAAAWGKVLEQCGHGHQFIAHLPSEGPPTDKPPDIPPLVG